MPRNPDYSGRCVLGVVAATLFASAPCPGDSQERYESSTGQYGIGRTPTAAEIQRVDIHVMPDGRGLPPGQGTVSRGKVLYDAACGDCHGAEGHGGPHGSLAGAALYRPADLAADKSLERTVGNYWPYATTLFDYIRRAMPYDRPGSLTADEIYAVTAYILFLNDLIDEETVIERNTLPGVEMPARHYFRADRGPEERR